MSIKDIKQKLKLFPNEDALSPSECAELAESHSQLLEAAIHVAHKLRSSTYSALAEQLDEVIQEASV